MYREREILLEKYLTSYKNPSSSTTVTGSVKTIQIKCMEGLISNSRSRTRILKYLCGHRRVTKAPSRSEPETYCPRSAPKIKFPECRDLNPDSKILDPSKLNPDPDILIFRFGSIIEYKDGYPKSGYLKTTNPDPISNPWIRRIRIRNCNYSVKLLAKWSLIASFSSEQRSCYVTLPSLSYFGFLCFSLTPNCFKTMFEFLGFTLVMN
ncbi:hypothetical protein YC2023_042710 [Brassica napus]